MSPEKNLDAKFCIHGVVWSLLRPSDSLKPHKSLFQQSWICAFKCAIDWTPELKWFPIVRDVSRVPYVSITNYSRSFAEERTFY